MHFLINQQFAIRDGKVFVLSGLVTEFGTVAFPLNAGGGEFGLALAVIGKYGGGIAPALKVFVAAEVAEEFQAPS